MRFAATVGLLLLAARMLAADYYVSTAATAGTGAIGDPWSITNAFTNRTVVASGDTIWLREGTYQKTNLFTVTLYAVSNNPIVIRNYAKERVVVDGGLLLTSTSNVWFWGLEIVDSGRTNKPTPSDTVSGVLNYGVKFINCLFHDCCIALAGGPYEAYGNVMWNCGKAGTEHAVYWQNDGIFEKVVENNLIGYASGFGLHSFSSSGPLSGLHFTGNAIWNCGAPLNNSKTGIFINGGQSITNLIVDQNSVIIATRGIEFGASTSNRNARIASNKVWGGRPLWQRTKFDIITVTNNVFGHADDGVWVDSASDPFFAVGPYDWDWNTYWSARFPNHDILTNGVVVSFANWKTATGFDANSTLTQNENVAGFLNSVEVRTNKYDATRGNIIVWNFASNHNVNVDISAVVPAGQQYVIRNAQDYWGQSWTGSYIGGSISLPMTNLSAASQLYWVPTSNNVSTAPRFAAFVVSAEAAVNAVVPARVGQGRSVARLRR